MLNVNFLMTYFNNQMKEMQGNLERLTEKKDICVI